MRRPQASGSITEAAVSSENDRPEFIRLPKSGSRCPWSGLSRSKLNELILPSPDNNHSPPVRSVSLRKAGQLKAARLVDFASLINYLRQLEREQAVSAAYPQIPKAVQERKSPIVSELAAGIRFGGEDAQFCLG